jgi:acetylglutamate kinase
VLSGITVVKVGGNELEDAAWVAALATAVASLPGAKVLVHGGGREVSALQRRLGMEPEWRDGLRLTTPEALRATRMVLSGEVNKRLVGALRVAGADALGISGEDGGLLRARLAAGGTLGRVGEVEEVRYGVLLRLLDAGFTPVVSPLAAGPDGEPLNLNADAAAAAIAAALGAAALCLVSNVPGLLQGGVVVADVGAEQVERWIGSGVAQGGMVPKLRAAAAAAPSVGEVRIGDLSLLRGGGGTRVRGAARCAAPT